MTSREASVAASEEGVAWRGRYLDLTEWAVTLEPATRDVWIGSGMVVEALVPHQQLAEARETFTAGMDFLNNQRLDAEARAQSAEAALDRLVEAAKPFARPWPMGDDYVSFAPRLILALRAALPTPKGEQP